MDQSVRFVQVKALHMLQHLFNSHREIDEINLEENSVKIVGPYNPAESLERLINQLKKGWEFVRAGFQKIPNSMMVSKGITFLEQTATFNKDIRGWLQQSSDLKTWASFKFSFTERTENR